MNDFMLLAKTQLQTVNSHKSVYVVLGNESCDLDSAVSALVYGYFIYNKYSSTNNNTCVIPILNIPNDEFLFRTETKYLLERNAINIDNLIFRNQIDLDELHNSGKLKLILVDHHILSEQDKHLAASVTEVIDHRPIDQTTDWSHASVTIDTVGSCATLIANIISKQSHILYDNIAKLLHGTIIIDTVNFNVAANRFTALDQEMATNLEKLGNITYTRGQIYSELSTSRSDVSGLTPFQILSRDMKLINGVPFCGVPMLVAEFLDLPDAPKSMTQFCLSKKSEVIILMGLITIDDEVFRDIGVFSTTNCVLKDRLTDCLQSNEDLKLLVVHKKIPGLLLFTQGNVKASRKHIVPMLLNVIDKYKKL